MAARKKPATRPRKRPATPRPKSPRIPKAQNIKVLAVNLLWTVQEFNDAGEPVDHPRQAVEDQPIQLGSARATKSVKKLAAERHGELATWLQNQIVTEFARREQLASSDDPRPSG